ncbi:acyltransferase-like protein At3g26840, chloroplastic [Rosa chinensis]|uniref:acyltransferase-like protein At3g26840, chloroplastic n=1 Tax=Rosa chinensis TaxID=74649 RepID=UPI001AD935AB|nr:acyltransferase-like protein At3g26840, chloroplastic [Rosa chinensis]
MASNALHLFPSRFSSILRCNLTSSFSINPSKMTRRLAVSTRRTSSMTATGENKSQPLEQERVSLKNFFDQAKDLVTSDVGPPHWFSPLDCGHPLHNSPLLLFLPGIDGTGLGLIMHHQKLGKIFEVLCLHIPPKDRTPFTDLVKLVERTIRSEHHRSPNRPIYLVGESLGACISLSVASRNPDIDLVLILANPATSFSRSPLQPILPLLQFMANLPNHSLPHVVSSTAGAMADLDKGVGVGAELLLTSFDPSLLLYYATALHNSNLQVLADILPIQTLLWKLEMINSASPYANSRLHAVKAQTLILSSGRDPLLPSQKEGLRLQRLLANCEICTFQDCSHFLFLEDAFDLVTVIKQVGVYRRSKERDFVSDYIPPSPSELRTLRDNNRWINIMSPVMLSTLADGTILWEQKGIHLRGIAHPMMFMKLKQGNLVELPFSDYFRLMGAVPVSGKNFFKLLSTKSHILLYPGGIREALHRKGEAYMLFWPERSEFVRMAARFGAKIVPFGTVGEDDFFDILLDYEDQMKIPFLKKYIDALSDEVGKLRTTVDGEVGNQDVYFPGILPKYPGRFYYFFGKTIETDGRKQELRDRQKAQELYLQVKSEVENCIAYLQEKRESDPYRSLVSRLLFQARHGFTSEVPAFDLD